MVGEEKVETGSGMVLDYVGMNNASVTKTDNKATGVVHINSAASEESVRKYSRRKSRRISRSCSMGSVLQDSGVSTNITTHFTDKVCAFSS